MNLLARRKIGGLINRRSYERMSKPRLRRIELDELRRDGGREGVEFDAPASNTSPARKIS